MSKKNFFVGYSDTFPRGLKVFYFLVIPILLCASFGFAYLFAKDTPLAGEGTWQLEETVTFTGLVTLDPYPMIVTEEDPGRGVLIVREGKLGAQELLREFDGSTIAIEGYLIERGPWRMLEIGGAQSIKPAEAAVVASLTLVEGNPVRLRGEIVDSKCMLGVMKPGVGKVHRDCARLCILGGFPPMLLVEDEGGQKAAFLLVDAEGKGISEAILPFVAVPVEVSGSLSKLGAMSVLHLDISSGAIAKIKR
jgi:hypothetical protein